MKTKRLLFVFEAMMLLVVVGLYSSQVFGKQGGREGDREGEKVPGQYIVVFRDGVTEADADAISDEVTLTHGLGLIHKYSHTLRGFSANISAERLDAVRRDPRVKFVSEDHVVNIYDNEKFNASARPGQQRAYQPTQPVQAMPTGVKRIGAIANSNKGIGIGVAVIDTGIDLYHPDLATNIASVNKTCISGTWNANDDNGHGTHVAGTIAALDNSIGVVGVAPKAKLFAVKVLNRNGSGTWSSVICGIDWITANAAKYGIKVANMSLGGGGTNDNNCGNTNGDALHQAICRSVAKGVTYVVAAGNSNADAANSVPSSYNDAVITVSALTDSDGKSGGLGAATGYGSDDTFATFSNYGSVVDIGAPGVNIFSTWKGGTYNTISGTSMATPHVTGAAALYIASHASSTWMQVRDALITAGEALNFGHTDPSGLHPEPVLQAGSL